MTRLPTSETTLRRVVLCVPFETMIIPSPRLPMLAACTSAALLAIPSSALAFSVTAAHCSSTIEAIRQWATTLNYELIWEPRTFNGVVNFPAPPQKVGDEFHAAVEALVSGAAYGRRNVYCVRPSEYEPHAMFDDEKRIVYVIGRPTGNRCIFTYP